MPESDRRPICLLFNAMRDSEYIASILIFFLIFGGPFKPLTVHKRDSPLTSPHQKEKRMTQNHNGKQRANTHPET